MFTKSIGAMERSTTSIAIATFIAVFACAEVYGAGIGLPSLGAQMLSAAFIGLIFGVGAAAANFASSRLARFSFETSNRLSNNRVSEGAAFALLLTVGAVALAAGAWYWNAEIVARGSAWHVSSHMHALLAVSAFTLTWCVAAIELAIIGAFIEAWDLADRASQ